MGWRGSAKVPVPLLLIFFSWVGSFLGIFVVCIWINADPNDVLLLLIIFPSHTQQVALFSYRVFLARTDTVMLVGSLGASAVLIYAAPNVCSSLPAS